MPNHSAIPEARGSARRLSDPIASASEAKPASKKDHRQTHPLPNRKSHGPMKNHVFSRPQGAKLALISASLTPDGTKINPA
jgi:hypothetical protein